MSRFEDRLWGELVEHHGALLAQPPALTLTPPARLRPSSLTRRRPLAVAGAALAAVAAAVVIALSSGGGPAPAYAVTQNPDGTVTVTVRELTATPALESVLVSMGLPVRAAPVEAACRTRPGQYRQAPLPLAGQEPLYTPSHTGGVTSVTIDPRRIPDGDTLLLGVREAGPNAIVLEIALYRGATPPCLQLTPTP